MSKQVITSDKLYPVYGPYSHAVRVDELIFLHGTVGFDARGQLPGQIPGRADMVGQCTQTIANMATALELLDSRLQDIVKVRAFVPQHCRPAQPGQRSFDETFDGVYREHFHPPRPARAALQQSLFLEDLLVEIEAIAIVDQPRRLIESDALPPLRRPYAQGGILVGDLLFLRGFTAQDQNGDLFGRGDMRAQTAQTFRNMDIVLQEVGGSMADLIQTDVTLTDWHAYRDYNEIYTQYVHPPFPTRATLQGGLGREGLLIEIESIAALGSPRVTIAAPTSHAGRSTPEQHANVRYADALAPAAGSYAHGVRVGDLMFVSGQLSLDAAGALIGAGCIGTQTQQVLAQVQTILQLADLDMQDVVKTTVMLTDWRHYTTYNDVYKTFFSPPYPARSTVGGGLAKKGALIEIAAIAVAGARDRAVAVTSP